MHFVKDPLKMWKLLFYGYILITFYTFNVICITDITDMINNSQIGDPELYKQTTTANQPSELKVLKNCSLVPKFPEVKHLISTLASENKLTKIKIEIIGEYGEISDTNLLPVYNPNKWIISTSLTGNSMLMLKEYFDAMSLMILGNGVASAPLVLTQSPENCLKGAHFEEFENTMRFHFLTNFNAEDNKLPEHAVICNAHVHTVEEQTGRIYYTCCSLTLDNMLECSILEESIWFKLLFALILAMQVLLVLYSPYFMPRSIADAKNVFLKYVFETESGKVLKLNVKKITENENVTNSFVKTIQHSLLHLTNFKPHLQTMVPGKIYTMYVKAVDISVRGSKIIAEGKAPVSVMDFIRNFFVRCNIRHEVPSVTKCCNQNMFVHWPCSVYFPWYYCLGFIMRILMGAVIISPWLLRVGFYYWYEEESILHQKQVLQNRNLTYPYPGMILTYLSPSHIIYVAIYLFLAIEMVLYTAMPDSVKRQLKRTVRTSIRDMNDTPKLEACGFFASHMLWPLQKFGVLGYIVLPVWLLVLPFCLILLSFEIFPIANLSIRLLVNALYYTFKTIKPDFLNGLKNCEEGNVKNWAKQRMDSILVVDCTYTNKRRHQIIQAVSLFLSLATMWVVIFIVIDCITFYVECAVYILIGFILNPRDTTKYASLILLIAVYGNECFSGVHNKYADYSKAINTEVRSLIGDKINNEAAKPESKQENVAFRVPNPDIISERLHIEAGSEGYLKWRAPRLAMFLDKSDIPYIPKIFLFEMAKLQHTYCPGVIHLLYLKALLDFSLILGFLMFVFIVIFAFGQSQDISSGGQTVAALGSGFLPLVFKKVLFQAQSGSDIDNSNLKWKNMFESAVQNFSTRWNFTDIHVTHAIENDFKVETDVSSGGIRTECDIETVTEVDTDESTDIFIEKTNPSLDENNQNMRGDIDLIVKTSLDREGKEMFTFYVPDNSIQDETTDIEIVVGEETPNDESVV